MAEREGVIKFDLEFKRQALGGQALGAQALGAQALEESLQKWQNNIAELGRWRHKLMQLGFIGQDPDRYGGLGFGNLSCRANPGFLITGTQTGELAQLDLSHYAWVQALDLKLHRVIATGETKPSSEAVTHGAVYAAGTAIQFVFHIHSPSLWQARDQLGLSATPADISYGTEAMALATKTLIQQQGATDGILAMAGHEDGLLAYGETAQSCGEQILNLL